MSMLEAARKNLEMAGLFDEKSDYGGMLGNAVMKLVETHCAEGHSGFSHKMAVHIFNKVIEDIPLTAEYWDIRKARLEEFALENMGEPWKPEMIAEMLGPRPTPAQE